MTTVARTDQGKDTVLFKLLTLGPEPFSQLVRCTGWDAGTTDAALAQLIEQRKVRRVRFRGVTVYQAVVS